MTPNHENCRRDQTIRAWLLFLGMMVYAMILIGGATRLTDSGLSITEWLPISGILPPLSQESWLDAFGLYKTTSEYKLQNYNMSLEEFKYIYWWEWAHRLFGRLIGLVAICGWVFFWVRKWLTRSQKIHYSILIGLGGLQGFIGWWMVASGVGESTRIDVAPYRLAIHFTLALLIIAYITVLWNALKARTSNAYPPNFRVFSTILLALIFVQMASGALVAGLDAGRTYTDWPTINGELVPNNYIDQNLGFRSLFEGIITTQFNHRIIAYILLFVAIGIAVAVRKEVGGKLFTVLATIIGAQSIWGVLTLINAAPIGLALIHQGFGVLILVYASYLVAISFGVGTSVTLSRGAAQHQ